MRKADPRHGLSRRSFVIGALSLGSSFPVLAAGETWPSQPMRFVSAGSPGGSSDIFVRVLESRLRERLGQPVILENQPGSGGMLAAGRTARATDAHTFFVSNLATNAIGVSLYKNVPFHPKNDLPPVARICTMTNALAVQSETGIKTVQELVSYIRANPTKALFGSAGVGTSSHLSGLLFAQRIGVEITHVPYRGTAANLNGLLRGDVLFSIDNLPLYLPHTEAKKVVLLGVTQATRSNFVPDIPTLQEAGISGFDIYSWFGLSAANGTPNAAIERLSTEIVSALALPEIAARIRAVGADPAPLDFAQYRAFISSEIDKWAPIVKASGATAD